MVKAITIVAKRRRRGRRPLRGTATTENYACLRCYAYTTHTRGLCQYGECDQFYCDRCGRYAGGFGPMGCPCEANSKGSGCFGHRTRGEQPRRKLPIKRLGRYVSVRSPWT